MNQQVCLSVTRLLADRATRSHQRLENIAPLLTVAVTSTAGSYVAETCADVDVVLGLLGVPARISGMAPHAKRSVETAVAKAVETTRTVSKKRAEFLEKMAAR